MGISVPDMSGVLTSISESIRPVSEMARSVIEGLAPTYERLRRQFQDIARTLDKRLPANWWGVDDPDWDVVATMAIDEGLPLAWVVPSDDIQRLLAADSGSHRRRILWQRRAPILTACERELGRLQMAGSEYFAERIREAAAALDSAHPAAAQALAVNVADTLGRHYLPRFKHHSSKNGRPSTFDPELLASALVLGALWANYRSYEGGKAPIPRELSRHATAHDVSKRQYSKINALIAVMLATSLLCWLDRRAAITR
ncbi:hypothetical protein LG322_06725 [Microbacterium aerolatum]|uniref:hypothetical protein n=1 Tax=Microbacterium aerolatum TaxID=153731 RepID=UPI00384F51ED